METVEVGAEQRGSASYDINSPVMGIQMGRKSMKKVLEQLAVQ